MRFFRFLPLCFGQFDITLVVNKTLPVLIFIYEGLMISKENDLSPSVTVLIFGIDSSLSCSTVLNGEECS